MKPYPFLLRPVSKEIMWGGNRLKEEYNKVAPFDKIAESWELTVRDDGCCQIANGEYTGISLEHFLKKHKSVLGKNCDRYDRFPLLIKFIDAADRLSIQVHPDDSYGLAKEGELGKTEMWYIMSCEPGARLVYGLKEGCTKKAFAEAVADGRTEEMLHTVQVHPGEVYFIPSGQVHAIGAGILIAEIQQNSNVTYRVYDYDRRQADGSLRPLHTQKALDVIRIRTPEEIDAIRFAHGDSADGGELLCACQYFTSRKYTADRGHTTHFHVDESSFVSLLILEAEGAEMEVLGSVYPLKKGESYFLPAGLGTVKLFGKTEVITSSVN